MSKVDNFFQEACNKNSIADPDKYYSLFEKYVPRYENHGRGKDIMLYGIGNLTTLRKLMEINPKAKYTIVEVETSLLEIIKTYSTFNKYNINVVDINNSDDWLGVFENK